eukprot:5017511-Amphidinium_carterae.1
MCTLLRTLWPKPQGLECQSIACLSIEESVCLGKQGLRQMRQRKTIQEVRDVQPLGLAHTPPRGRNKKRYFDMVAELAIELARIC